VVALGLFIGLRLACHEREQRDASRPHRSAQFREQLELVGVAHNTPATTRSTVASASGTADPTARTWEAEQGPSRVAAPGLWFDEQRRHAHPLRGIRGRSPHTGTAVEQRFLGVRSSSSINQSTVGLQSIRNSLSNAPNSPSSVPRLRAKEDPRHKSPRSVICRTR
jgi:hypothetical protein